MQFCSNSYLINIHILDYPDSRLFRPFNPVPTSPDNQCLTVNSPVSFWGVSRNPIPVLRYIPKQLRRRLVGVLTGVGLKSKPIHIR